MADRSAQYQFERTTKLTAQELNVRFLDVNARLLSVELERLSETEAFGAVLDRVLSRSEDVIASLRDRLLQITELQWLTARSATARTLAEGATFFLEIVEEDRPLFAPGPFAVLTRESSPQEYAVVATLGWDRETGRWDVEVSTFVGDPGPHADWQATAIAGSTLSQLALLEEGRNARSLAVEAAQNVAADRIAVAEAREEVGEKHSQVSSAAAVVAGAGAAAALANEKAALAEETAAAAQAVVDAAPALLEARNETLQARDDAVNLVPALNEKLADHAPRLFVNGETGDPDIRLAVIFEDMTSTFMQVGPDGAPTPAGAALISGALDFVGPVAGAITSAVAEQAPPLVVAGLEDRGVVEPKPIDAEVAWAFHMEDYSRTWLEIGHSGAPTAFAAQRITQALDAAALSGGQVAALATRLGVNAVPPPETVQVATVPPTVSLMSAPKGVGREYPVLVRVADINPIIDIAAQAYAVHGMWPTWADLRHEGVAASGVLWSTDHAGASTAGIFLSTAPHPETPAEDWTHHGLIFKDDTAGQSQCETPAPRWNRTLGKWELYYQMAGVTFNGVTGQRTKRATISRLLDDDGLANTYPPRSGQVDEWEIEPDPVLFTPAATMPGDGHTGYFRPWDEGDSCFGHSLVSGTGDSIRGFWVGVDTPAGTDWYLDPRFIGHNAALIDHLPGWDETWLLQSHTGAIVMRNGQRWLITMAGPVVAGGVDLAGRVVVCPMRPDGRTFGRAIDITPAAEAWEGVLGMERIGGTIDWDGATYVAYRDGGKYGGFGLAKVL